MKPKQPKIVQVTEAPPFDRNWKFVVIPQTNFDHGFYSLTANHDLIPGDGQGLGFRNGKNYGHFIAGGGEGKYPKSAPVGWWGYQHNFNINRSRNTFRGTFEVLDITFENMLGNQDGGEAKIWACIMQCQIDRDKLPEEYEVLDATLVEVPMNFTGTVVVQHAAKTSSQLGISNTGENYALRMAWLIQGYVEGAQSVSVEIDGYFRKFTGSRLLSEVEVGDFIDEVEPDPIQPGKQKSSPKATAMPKGFLQKGKIVGLSHGKK